MLFLAEKVRLGGQIVRGTAREITEWFGVNWRPHSTLTRLRRVASCWIERPNGRGGHERLRVAEWFWESDNQFELIASREFLRDVQAGAVYSLDIARRFATQPAILDLYLWMVLHQRHKPREWDPYALLPAPQARTKKWQLLRERAALIARVWPECPFQVDADGRTLIHVDVLREARERHLAARAAQARARQAAAARPQPSEPWFYKSDEPARPSEPWFYKSDEPARPADLSMFLHRPRQGAASSSRAQPPIFQGASTKTPAELGVFVYRGRPTAIGGPPEPPRSTARPATRRRKSRGKRKP
jgi:hypothetical protein